MNDRSKPKPNPLLEKLVKAAGDDTVAQLEGYAGPCEGGSIRLYLTLGLESYLEIPEDAFLHTEELSNRDGRVRAYVLGSTEIRLVSRHSISVPASRLSFALRVGQQGTGGAPSPEEFAHCVNTCIYAWLRCLETNPALERMPDLCDKDLTACIRRCSRVSGLLSPI